MNILIINASPRKGNSIFLAEAIASHLEGGDNDISFINLPKLKISHCVSCRGCKKDNATCVIKDDMQSLYPKFSTADKIIILSQNYFGFVNSILLTFIDRLYALFTEDRKCRIEAGKKIIFIVTQGAPDRARSENIISWAKSFFERFGAKFYGLIIPNCKYDNIEGAKLKLEEVKNSISIF